MASVKTKSEFVQLKKMFLWEIDNTNGAYFAGLLGKLSKKSLYSSKMTAVDPYNGIKYTGIFKIEKNDKSVSFSIDINPDPGIIKYYYFVNDLPVKEGCALGSGPSVDLKKISLYVDVFAVRHQPFKLCSSSVNEKVKFPEQLKQMWKADPVVKFLIKCKGNNIEAIKPIMATCSPVFRAMFDREWKESTQNSVEINDFDPKVVQEMIEFCENGAINNVRDYKELHRIADKYQVQELIELSLEILAETMTVENVHDCLQIARQHKLKDFKKNCIIFCVQNGIFDF